MQLQLFSISFREVNFFLLLLFLKGGVFMDYYTALVFYKTGHYDSYNCNDVTDALSFISSCNSVHYAFITSFPDCRYIPVFTCNSGIDISYCDFLPVIPVIYRKSRY